MLRITIHDNPQVLTFQLEGRLTGPWLRELEECWQNIRACWHRPIIRVDLTGVTYIDAAGQPVWRPCTVRGPSSSPLTV